MRNWVTVSATAEKTVSLLLLVVVSDSTWYRHSYFLRRVIFLPQITDGRHHTKTRYVELGKLKPDTVLYTSELE
jgi:hypothetical protein